MLLRLAPNACVAVPADDIASTTGSRGGENNSCAIHVTGVGRRAETLRFEDSAREPYVSCAAVAAREKVLDLTTGFVVIDVLSAVDESVGLCFATVAGHPAYVEKNHTCHGADLWMPLNDQEVCQDFGELSL